MADSTAIFLNAIISSIRHNFRYTISSAGFKLTTQKEDPNNLGTYIPTGEIPTADIYIPATSINGNITNGKLEFRYARVSSGDKFYLPAGGTNVEKIKLYCKFSGVDSTAGSFTGINNGTWILVHESASISPIGSVYFDANDYLTGIEMDLDLSTSTLSGSRLVEKFFAANSLDKTGTIMSQNDNRPTYFMFQGVTTSQYLKSEESINKFYSNEGLTTVVNQFTDDIEDDAGCIVHLPPQADTSPSYDNEKPITYELYTTDDVLIDSGTINEPTSTSGILWNEGDSVNFTYTNSILTKRS